MSNRIEQTIRVLREGEAVPGPAAYWRTRSCQERLAETMNLHRDGNEPFKGGYLPHVFVIEVRHVVDP